MNIKEDKYYYSKDSLLEYSSNRDATIKKWNPNYLIEVDENVEHHQYISISFDKLKVGSFAKPKSSKYQVVRPIIKEVFLTHYNLAVKSIYEITTEDGEFYIRKNSSTWFEIAYFFSNEKDKRAIEIDFRDSIEELFLVITGGTTIKNRPQYRKKGYAITKEKFMQFLNCTLQFVYDSDSYDMFIDDYVRKFYQLLEDDNRIEGFVISAEKSFEKILNQLLLRKNSLEKRLIENDSDSANDRSKIRGELEGILYAIRTVNTYNTQ